jgi:DeoR family transcriptional regulator of aga operon
MMQTVQQAIVLANSSKFSKRGFGRICGLKQVAYIITDQGIAAADSKKQ